MNLLSRVWVSLSGRAAAPAAPTGPVVRSADADVTHLDSDNQLTRASRPGEEPAAPRRSFEAGRDVGPYRIVRRLGQGGMGEVYEAEQVLTRRRVALKVLTRSLDNPEATARFLREGRLAAAVSHPNSVYIYASHELDGVPMIAMELVAGGTLQELVDREGPLPSARAVDVILQVMAGLEAAHATGVLHRDVKPSNCFIDGAGNVKVGDYGLSLSTMASGSTQLTMQGTFLGTPAYASPEQVSASVVDVRSDIYSVGATLYFLLSGRPPFAHASAMQVFAAVLREDPPSPRVHVPLIPEPLAQIVLRSLRKDPAARYATYDDLRQALLPFSSRPLEAATIRLRVLAWLIDSAGLFVVGLSIGAHAAVQDFEAGFQAGRTSGPAPWPSLWSVVVPMATSLVYYGICEGVWGAGLGKRAVGLRVARLDGRMPGIWRATLRNLTMIVVTNVGTLILYATYGTHPKVPPRGLWLTQVYLAMIPLLWATARKGNGYRGLHEWTSGTRVVRIGRAGKEAAAVVQPAAETPLAAGSTGEQIGTYAAESVLWSHGDEQLISARDDVLRRHVWIHRVPAGTAALDPRRQNCARATRLRVLSSVRTDAVNHDVYEAVAGSAIGTAQPWPVVRQALLDLTIEWAAAREDGTLPTTLTLDHVWVTPTGIRLLDFPIASPSLTSSAAPRDLASAQAFMSLVVDRMASGAPEPSLGWPLSALTVVAMLRRRGFSSLEELRAALDQSSTKVIPVSRQRRLVSCMPAAVLPGVTFLIAAIVTVLNYRIQRDAQLDELDLMMTRIVQMESQTTTPINIRQKDALTIYVGDRFGSRIAALGMLDLDPIEKAAALRARERAQAASPDDRDRAARDAAPVVTDIRQKAAARAPFWSDAFGRTALGVSLALAIEAGMAAILALVLRGPVGLWLVGLTIATTDGDRPGRLRALWRTIVVLSPALVAMLAVGALAWLAPPGTSAPLRHARQVAAKTLPGAGLFIFLAGFVWTMVRPSRGPQDRLSGTVVLPL